MNDCFTSGTFHFVYSKAKSDSSWGWYGYYSKNVLKNSQYFVIFGDFLGIGPINRPRMPKTYIFWNHCLIRAKLSGKHMQHAMIISEMHEFSTLLKTRLRARSLDAFSHLYREFQYRLISTYTFSESSRHFEHNDMRQGYVLINRLGCRAPWRVRWRHPHVRGRKKLLRHFTA